MKIYTHCYYLHVNKSLLVKPLENVSDIRESDLALGLWFFDPNDRENCWSIAVEALASGAKKERINELAQLWELTETDALIYANFQNCLIKTEGNKKQATLKTFVNIQESPAGFGDSSLEALADLAKQLGYKPFKTWGATFASLCSARTQLDLK